MAILDQSSFFFFLVEPRCSSALFLRHVVYLCLLSSSDDKNKFCHCRASLVHSASSIVACSCWCVGGSSITMLPLLVQIIRTFATVTIFVQCVLLNTLQGITILSIWCKTLRRMIHNLRCRQFVCWSPRSRLPFVWRTPSRDMEKMTVIGSTLGACNSLAQRAGVALLWPTYTLVRKLRRGTRSHRLLVPLRHRFRLIKRMNGRQTNCRSHPGILAL